MERITTCEAGTPLIPVTLTAVPDHGGRGRPHASLQQGQLCWVGPYTPPCRAAGISRRSCSPAAETNALLICVHARGVRGPCIP